MTPASSTSSCRTLIIEDDPRSGYALKRLIAAMGHEVQLASTLQAGLRLLPDWHPSCVLIDLMLPDGNGSELLRRIRESNLDTRVAITTGTSNPQMLSAVKALKPDAVFIKPLDLHQIESFLRPPTEVSGH